MLLVGFSHDPQIELGPDIVPARLAEPPSLIRIREQTAHRLCQGRLISRIEQDTGLALGDNCRHPTDSRGNHRAARGPRLENGQRHPLEATGQGENVHQVQEMLRPGLIAGEVNPIGKSEIGSQLSQRLQLWSIADQEQMRLRITVRNVREAADQQVLPLDFVQPADGADHRGVRGMPRLCRRDSLSPVESKRGRVDAIKDDADLSTSDGPVSFDGLGDVVRDTAESVGKYSRQGPEQTSANLLVQGTALGNVVDVLGVNDGRDPLLACAAGPGVQERTDLMRVDDIGFQLPQQVTHLTDRVRSQSRFLVGTQHRNARALHLGGESAWPFQTDHRRVCPEHDRSG